jgi:hypothetical protein
MCVYFFGESQYVWITCRYYSPLAIIIVLRLLDLMRITTVCQSNESTCSDRMAKFLCNICGDKLMWENFEVAIGNLPKMSKTQKGGSRNCSEACIVRTVLQNVNARLWIFGPANIWNTT